VLQRSYVWTGLILVLAVAGALFAGRVALPDRFLALALAGAALLAPAEQARIHTTVSLQKHVVFGAWFAAIGAGYLMSRLSRLDRGHGWPAVMALPIVASTLFGSYGQANGLYEVWPNSAGVVTALRPLAREHPGLYLAEDYDVEAYYLQSEVPWQDWSNTYYFRYPGQGPGPASYAAAIDRHYFALVILNFGDTRATDRLIVADIDRAGGYRVVDRSGRFTVWASAARG